MVEHVALLAEIDRVEGEVVEVRRALVDQRHHMVVRVDPEPHPCRSEPVADLHAKHLGVETDTVSELAGQTVDVAKAPRPSRMDRAIRARVLYTGILGTMRGELQEAAVMVCDQQRAVEFLDLHADALQMGTRHLWRAGCSEL